MAVLRFKQSPKPAVKKKTSKMMVLNELRNTCGNSPKFTIKENYHFQQEDRLLQSGDAIFQGRVHQLEECISKCCKTSSCTLAYLVGDDCYSVGCHSETACRPIKTESQTKELSFSVIVVLDKRWGLLESNQNDNNGYLGKKTSTKQESSEKDKIDLPTKTAVDDKSEARDTENSEKDLSKESAEQTSEGKSHSTAGKEKGGSTLETTDDVDVTTSNNNNNNKNCPNNQDTLWDTVLRGGWKAGIYTEYKHIKKIDECQKRCCNSMNCNVALVMVHCYLVQCHDYESCQPMDAKVHYFKPHLIVVRPPKIKQHGVSLASRMKKLDTTNTNAMKDNDTDDNDLEKSLGELKQPSDSLKNHDQMTMKSKSNPKPTGMPQSIVAVESNTHTIQASNNNGIAQVGNHTSNATKLKIRKLDNILVSRFGYNTSRSIKDDLKGKKKTNKLVHDISNKLGELEETGKNTTLLNNSGPGLGESDDTADRYEKFIFFQFVETCFFSR